MPFIFTVSRRRVAGCFLACLLVTGAAFGQTKQQGQASGSAQDQSKNAEGDTPDSSTSESAPAAPAKPSIKLNLSEDEKSLAELELLLDEKLPSATEPDALFGFPLSEEEKVQEARVQLEAKLNAHVQSLKTGEVSDKKEQEVPAKASTPADTAEPPEGEPPEKDTSTLPTDPKSRAISLRLRFLSLSEDDRLRILAEHAQRKAAAAPVLESERAEQRAVSAEKARQEALEAARLAHTEAERLVAEETARLLQIKRKQAEFDARLARRKADLLTLEERYLSLQRRARDALDAPEDERVISLHEECEALARETQEAFALAVSHGPLIAPEAGENRLVDASLSVDVSGLEKLRTELAADKKRLDEMAVDIRWQRRDQLYFALRGTNEIRLELFSILPADRKSSQLGLSGSGIAQAAFELKQVSLVIRYHAQVTSHWIEKVRRGHRADGAQTIMTGAVFAQLLVLLWLYFFARRRLPLLLAAAKKKDAESDEDPNRLPMRALTLLHDIHGPLLFLGLLWVVHERLPVVVQTQFEISLFYRAAIWLTSANLLIQLINSLSGRQGRAVHLSAARIRLRSLRLVGRTVAYIGLTLSLTSQLVGRGTIYHWVIQLTWLLVVPIILLLCHWWRPLVHAYIQEERRKSPFREWVLRHKTGIIGLVGAGLAGIDLGRVALVRALRGWADEFVVARRVGAYLFQRELDRRAVEEPLVELQPLPQELFERLSPELPSPHVSRPGRDEDCKPILSRIKSGRGGIFALVGERGAGKSSYARRFAEEHKTLIVAGCDTLVGLERSFQTALGQTSKATLEESIEHISASGEIEIVIIEGAHYLIRPLIGGIAAFDELISFLSPRAKKVAWVLTFEDAVWNFFSGARGVRPTFDEAIQLKSWSESDLRNLLETRSELAKIEPDFQLLISALPKDADEIDRLDALEKAKKSFYRLIWDYAAGNPGVALHMWRQSLAASKDGVIYVQLFQAPRAEELVDLPDGAAFVLRAVVQLGNASLEEISQLTRLNRRMILDTIRYAQAIRLLEPINHGYSVTWLWYRAVTRYLHRRHLLAIVNLNGAGAA